MKNMRFNIKCHIFWHVFFWWEQGEEVGKGAWMWKGGRVGPGRCWPPRAFCRQGVSRKAMTFVFCVLICMQFRKLHSWQTCNMACSSRGQVDISARSSTYSIPPIQICVVPLCYRPGARLITAWGNLVCSSWMRSATNMPNRVGLRRLPSRMSTVWRSWMLGCKTRSWILSMRAQKWCHIWPTMSLCRRMDDSLSRCTEG